MAIGLGRIFGFHFLENFNYPYIAKSITEFWRRWHISLGSWFREYLYIPLGGNRQGPRRTYINLFLVFCVTGLWHGANWTFVLWGLWHGLFIVAERAWGIKNTQSGPWDMLRHSYTILAIVLVWTMFRADTITEGLGMIGAMFGLTTPSVLPQDLLYYLDGHNMLILALAVLFSMPIRLPEWLKAKAGAYVRGIYQLGLVALLILCMANLASSTYNPFIYFRF